MVACTSVDSGVLLYDVNRGPIPLMVLQESVRPYFPEPRLGSTDICFPTMGKSSLLASDLNGNVNLWDLRASRDCPSTVFRDCPSTVFLNRGDIHDGRAINSVKIDVENKVVFGASSIGFIHCWDLHMGEKPGIRLIGHEKYCPLRYFKLASGLEKIRSLKEQSEISPKGIHSIDLNPSCPYQLAFHLADGWSGVLDISNERFEVTHLHAPPHHEQVAVTTPT